MDQRAEIRDFLRSRRARISPEQVNLAGGGGGHRRVAGLRREEVAMLAGVSVDYYARLERGNLAGVSDEVLGSIARTLQLDEAETAHLFDLARALRTTLSPRRRPTLTQHVRPGLQRLLDGWVGFGPIGAAMALMTTCTIIATLWVVSACMSAVIWERKAPADTVVESQQPMQHRLPL